MEVALASIMGLVIALAGVNAYQALLNANYYSKGTTYLANELKKSSWAYFILEVCSIAFLIASIVMLLNGVTLGAIISLGLTYIAVGLAKVGTYRHNYFIYKRLESAYRTGKLEENE